MDWLSLTIELQPPYPSTTLQLPKKKMYFFILLKRKNYISNGWINARMDSLKKRLLQMMLQSYFHLTNCTLFYFIGKQTPQAVCGAAGNSQYGSYSSGAGVPGNKRRVYIVVQPLDYLSALFGPLDTQLLDVLNFIFVLVSVTRYSDMVVECGHLTLHFSPKACQTFFFFFIYC